MAPLLLPDLFYAEMAILGFDPFILKGLLNES